MRSLRLGLAGVIALGINSLAGAADPVSGWRGNGTGLWPEAKAPLEWHRTPRGAMEGLRAQIDRPAEKQPAGDAVVVKKGLIIDWLVLGPFPVADAVKDIDHDPLGGEADIAPSSGETAAGKTWTKASIPPDDITVFGTAVVPILDLAKALGYRKNHVGYAHAYVHSPRGGPARMVVDHTEGLKAWVNGREVYRSPERQAVLGFYTAISRHELDFLDQRSARIDVELKPGWNRLLFKVATSNKDGYTQHALTLRLSDPPGVQYDEKNILWKTELPERSTSTPILVGDRIFVMAEPDELVCLDRSTGRILWKASHSYYDALPADQRAARPEYAADVEPLVTALKNEPDRFARLSLRAKLRDAQKKIDERRYKIDADGHFEAHFGIVGFTMATPVCDGKHLYVWCGNGVAASYDLDGNRRWITRLEVDHLAYGSSPALADGVLAVFMGKLYGLDAETGKVKWTQPRVQKNVASLMAARIDGHDVIITQQGELVRPSDGEILFRPRGITAGDTGWSPPVIIGDSLYLPRYGVAQLNVFDFEGSASNRWKPNEEFAVSWEADISKGPDGKWVDRWTAGSPLIWDGLAYEVDMYQVLYVLDLKERAPVYRKPLDLDGFTHYNALAVAASPTLIGKHVYVGDNQGTTLVLEPGRELKVVAKNHIGTQIDRTWPVPPQETLAYAPPVTDGSRIYLRGERFLYCIGEK